MTLGSLMGHGCRELRSQILAHVSIGTVTEATSAIRSTGKISVTVDDSDARALVRYVRKNSNSEC